MNIAAERNFGLWRGATSGHIQSDLDARSDNATGQHPMWFWHHQWPLFGWQNGLISVALFCWAMALAVRRSDSFIGVFNHRADRVFVLTLRHWLKSDAPTQSKL